MIVLTALRGDITLPDEVVEGRCVAFIPETKKYYPSEPFLTIGAREGDSTPEIIEKPEDDGISPIFSLKEFAHSFLAQ